MCYVGLFGFLIPLASGVGFASMLCLNCLFVCLCSFALRLRVIWLLLWVVMSLDCWFLVLLICLLVECDLVWFTGVCCRLAAGLWTWDVRLDGVVFDCSFACLWFMYYYFACSLVCLLDSMLAVVLCCLVLDFVGVIGYCASVIVFRGGWLVLLLGLLVCLREFCCGMMIGLG